MLKLCPSLFKRRFLEKSTVRALKFQASFESREILLTFGTFGKFEFIKRQVINLWNLIHFFAFFTSYIAVLFMY